MRIDCAALTGNNVDASEQLGLATKALVRDGYVILGDILPGPTVLELNKQFDLAHRHFLRDCDSKEVLKVGNRRYMVPVSLAGRFRDPLVYANPVILAIVRTALGGDAILESFGAVISLSGSEAQHIHRDGPFLFDAGISPILPAHALTVVIPLIEMNEEHGTTAIWPGSHRWIGFREQVVPEAPLIPTGSCAIWDFRLFHGGTANRSDAHRAILYITYARCWYRDPKNFVKHGQKRISWEEDFVDCLSEDHRKLFSQTRCG